MIVVSAVLLTFFKLSALLAWVSPIHIICGGIGIKKERVASSMASHQGYACLLHCGGMVLRSAILICHYGYKYRLFVV